MIKYDRYLYEIIKCDSYYEIREYCKIFVWFGKKQEEYREYRKGIMPRRI